ncbi:hypothetical protein C7M84_015595 [Penaeus vannamei]|uniref:Gustatory receptor n=1 Tax=Penaeus vannamei TaxID=6689 RepID=A0A423SQD5_PENVA|nr:hypothetical protein C7M84_015595 [Penaeus vannamei]
MSSRVPLFVRLLRLWARTLRLLGGFPYSWDGRQAGAILPALRRRGGRRFWPVLLTLLYAAAIVVPTVCLFVGFQEFNYDGSTSETFVKLQRSAEVTISAYLCVHVLVGRHDSASLVAHFDLHFPEYTKRDWMLVRDKKAAVLVFSHFFFLLTVMGSVILGTLGATGTLSLIVWVIWSLYFLYNITLAFVQEISSYTFSCLLNKVLADTLRSIKSQEDGSGNVTKAETGDYKTHAITSVKPAAAPREAGSSHVKEHGAEAALATTLRLHDSRHVQEKASTDGQELNRDEIMTLYKRVYRAHECQLLMNKYFGPPALGHMSLAVLWLIGDAYHVAVERMDWLLLLHWAIQILHSSTKIAVFCWPAEAIKDKVQELHFAVSWRRATASDPSLQTQLSFLLELLERFPGFDVVGFFSAAKARIISSIFTYIVILSQFKLSEKPE